MNWLKNLKVSQKLAILISVLLIAVVLVGGTGYYFLSKTNDSANKMYSEKLMAVELINDNRTHARKIEGNTYALMITTDEKENKELFDEITQRGKQFDENLTKFEQIPIDDADKAKVKEIKEDLQKYRAVRVKVLELAMQNKNAEAFALYNQQGKALSNKFTDELRGLAENMNKSAAEMNKQNHKDFVFANGLFIAVITIAILLGILLGWLIVRQVTSRLNDVTRYLGVVSSGDFSQDITRKAYRIKVNSGRCPEPSMT